MKSFQFILCLLLAACSTSNTHAADDLPAGAIARIHAKNVHSLCFTPDGKSIVYGGENGVSKIHEIATGKTRALEGHRDRVTALKISPDGKTLASGASSGEIARGENTVRFWDLGSGRQTHIIQDYFRIVSSISFSPDGRTVAFGELNNRLRIFEIETGKVLMNFKGNGSDGGSFVAFSRDSKLLASSGETGTTAVDDVVTGKRLCEFPDGMSALSFSADGKTLYAAHYYGLDACSLESKKRVPMCEFDSFGCVFTTDGRFLFTGEWVIETATAKKFARIKQPQWSWIAISDDAKFVATCLGEYKELDILIWDVEKMKVAK